MHTTLLPEGWPRPKGYANGVLARGSETIFVGGQIGWNADCVFECHDFSGQSGRRCRTYVMSWPPPAPARST
jgi:enamine deaminase RidA (YjgF/YER057c/UK114 family)